MESMTGLEIMAGEWTMSSLIGKLTSQPFVLLVILTALIQSYWKWNALINFHAVQLFQLLSVCSELLCIAKLWSESWVKCSLKLCVQFAYWKRHLGSCTSSHKIKNIFTFISYATTFFRTSDRLRKKNFTGFSGTDSRKNRLISREVAEIFRVNFTDKQQLKISKSIKQLPNGSRSKETVNNKTKTQGESSSFLFLSKNGI